MRKFIEKLSSIGTDKWMHLLVCTVISCAFCSIVRSFTYDIFLAPIMAVFFTMILGISKEAYDSYQEGNTFDWEDLFCDVIGAFLGIILASL